MSDTFLRSTIATTLENLQHRLNVKKLELDSLLEVTQAINNNLPEDSIYKIYHFILRANLNINKLALFVLDTGWECKVNFGTETDYFGICFPKENLAYRSISRIQPEDHEGLFGEFDLVIPIAHKKTVLAYVFVGNTQKDDGNNLFDTVFIQTLSNFVIVAIENKKLARQQLLQETLNREIAIAQQVQSLLFPKNLPATRQLKVRAEYFPHRSIGGDYYDFIRISDDEFLVCIADVSGKGIPAAILMSNFQASLRTMIRQTNKLVPIVEELNYQIYQNARGENFITFFAAVYNRRSRKLCYINAGHNPPLFYEPGREIRLLDKGTTILGTFSPLPFLEETELENVQEFTLLCYTDGVTEVNNPQGEEYGPDNLIRFFEQHKHGEPEQINAMLIQTLNAFKQEKDYDDDVTLLTCKVSHP